METTIKNLILQLGADTCGIAAIDRFSDTPSGFRPTDLYADCRSVIVFGKAMPKGLLHVDPRLLYIKANDVNLEELDRISCLASLEIEGLGAVTVPLPSDSPYEYWDSERKEGRGLLSMRHAAVQAGLGRMGKSTLVINRRFGSLMNYGALLTNLELESDPLAEDLCIPGCRICLDSCPSQALDGTAVIQKLCREHTYGTNERGFGTCTCNTCRTACPWAAGER